MMKPARVRNARFIHCPAWREYAQPGTLPTTRAPEREPRGGQP